MKKAGLVRSEPEPESNCRICLDGGKVKLSRSCQQCPRAVEFGSKKPRRK